MQIVRSRQSDDPRITEKSARVRWAGKYLCRVEHLSETTVLGGIPCSWNGGSLSGLHAG